MEKETKEKEEREEEKGKRTDVAGRIAGSQAEESRTETGQIRAEQAEEKESGQQEEFWRRCWGWF